MRGNKQLSIIQYLCESLLIHYNTHTNNTHDKCSFLCCNPVLFCSWVTMWFDCSLSEQCLPALNYLSAENINVSKWILINFLDKYFTPGRSHIHTTPWPQLGVCLVLSTLGNQSQTLVGGGTLISYTVLIVWFKKLSCIIEMFSVSDRIRFYLLHQTNNNSHLLISGQ